MSMEKGGSNQQPPQTIVYTAPIRSGGATGGYEVNDNDPRYKCCCGCMHVRNGAILLAIIELVFGVLGVLAALLGGGGRNRMGTSSLSFVNCVVTIIVSSSMIYGLKKTRRYFLIPHVMLQFFSIIGFMVGAIFLAIFAIGSGGQIMVTVLISISIMERFLVDAVETLKFIKQSRCRVSGHNSSEYSPLIYGIAAALCLIAAILECWFFVVIWGAFRYLRDKQTARLQGSPMVQHGGGGNM